MKRWALFGGSAFYVSLLTHAALMLYLLRHDLKTFWLYLPPLAHVRFDGVDVNFVVVDDADLPPLYKRIGEETGKGFGSHQSLGPDLLYARQGPQDQAWLSRDPVGPGPTPLEPSRNTTPSNPGGAETVSSSSVLTEGTDAGAIGAPAIDGLVTPTVITPPIVKLIRKSEIEPIAPGPDDRTPPSTQPAQDGIATAMTIEPTAAGSGADQQVPRRGNPASKVNTGPAADPAPESDSESDAFARIGSARFKNGKLDVRLGRKVKTVKPQFTIKGGLDHLSIVKPVTVVLVTVADSGKVNDVRVLRSSGSNEIDLPWVLAVYKWWFEPTKNADGKTTADIVQLTLGIIDSD